jgi:hypothetical protein
LRLLEVLVVLVVVLEVLDWQARGAAAYMSRGWKGGYVVGGLIKVLAGVGRSDIPFIGVLGVGLMVVIDIHDEFEASHDGRLLSLDLEVRYQVSNTQPGWTALDK